MYHNMFGSGMWYGWIFWLVILIVIGWLILNHMNKNKRDTQSPQQESALDILKKRFAQGEIDKGEFERMKKDLE